METPAQPALQPYIPIGFFVSATEHGQGAGTCWKCGSGIKYVVSARHTITGDTITVGTTCAEQIGLDAHELRALRDAYYRPPNRQPNRPRGNRAAELEHGDPRKFNAGCDCDPCTEAAIASGQWRPATRTVLYDLDGRPVDNAHLVSTRYGLAWRIGDDRDDPTWVTAFPARRATIVRKGYIEAETSGLVYLRLSGDEGRTLRRPVRPTTDRWGEPLPNP